MDNKEFLQICKTENNKLAAIEVKEIPSDELAFKSLIIINSMKVAGDGDALLFAAALNVLNTYVKLSKENKKLVGYSFKNKVNVLFNYILENPSEYIDAEIQEDNGMSLGLIEIYGIQFSFHNVTVSEDMMSLKVKDPDHPRLTWGGIKKQVCSVSLFNFSYENSFDRTNKLLDGSDFLPYIDSLVEEFRAGAKTISDVLHSKNSESKQKSSYVLDTHTYDYPDKSRFLISLGSYTLENLREKIINRTLVPELNNIYQQRTGLYLPYARIISAKYAFQTFSDFLEIANLNHSIGIEILYSKVPFHEAFLVFLTSCDENNRKSVVCIELLSWTSIKNADDGYVTVLDDYTGLYRTTRIPGSVMHDEISSVFEEFLVSHNINIKHCVFLYDAEKTNSDKLIYVSEADTYHSYLFYAAEMKAMADFIADDLKSGNGEEIVKKLHAISDSFSSNTNGQLSYEHILAVGNCVDRLKSGEHALEIFNYRKAKGNTVFYDYFVNYLKSSNIKFHVFTSSDSINSQVSNATALFVDCIPEEFALDKFNSVIVLCDLYSPFTHESSSLANLTEYAFDKKIAVYTANIVDALGFADGGDGNNYLLRYLGLSSIEYRYFDADKYPIYIGEKSHKSSDDGVKTIVISENIGYDCDNMCIDASLDEKENLYQQLLDAPNGVQLCIENTVLRSYLKDCLSSHNDYEKWIEESKASIDADFAEILKLVKKNLGNTSDYNKYLAMAVQSLHKESWSKLSESSQDWVVSAISNFFYMKDVDKSMDFSGVELLISKSFEVELCKRISEDYVDYMESKYTDSYLNELPDTLVKETPSGLKLQNPGQVTLGSMPSIMGLDSKGHIKNTKSYNHFLEYCHDVLLEKPDNAEKVLSELCEIIFHVRVNYRNTSAHKEAISFESASDCISYCITDQRKLGVIMDMFRK